MSAKWTCCGRTLDTTGGPLVMGVLNVTPDSFSDGGCYVRHADAVAHAMGLVEEGADIIDVGGESTRPGAAAVSESEERDRVVPVIRELTRCSEVTVSVDTMKASVADAALDAGARIVNDVSALTHDAAMMDVTKRWSAGIVLMHMAGTPRTMQNNPQYEDVVEEVRAYLADRVAACEAAGVPRERMCVDPGIGFGKTTRHNIDLLRHVDVFSGFGVPVLIGLSRKRFLGELTGREVGQRLAASLAALSVCVFRGVDIMRVHDVAASRDAGRVAAALRGWT